MLGLPVPVSCLRSPPSQPDSIGLLLQLDSIPYFPGPPPGSRIAATTGTGDPTATAPDSHVENMVHLDSMSPASLLICSKLSQRWELKTSLTEGSVRRSQQTLTMCLGLQYNAHMDTLVPEHGV